MFCLHMYVCASCACVQCLQRTKRVLDPLEMDRDISTASGCVVARKTCVFCKKENS